MQLVIETFDLLCILPYGVVQLFTLKVKRIGHLPQLRLLLNGVATDPLSILFITLVSLQVHLDVALNAECINYADDCCFSMQEKSKSDIVNTRSLHDKVVVYACMLPDDLKAFIVVCYFDVKDVSQVVLISNIQGGL